MQPIKVPQETPTTLPTPDPDPRFLRVVHRAKAGRNPLGPCWEGEAGVGEGNRATRRANASAQFRAVRSVLRAHTPGRSKATKGDR